MCKANAIIWYSWHDRSFLAMYKLIQRQLNYLTPYFIGGIMNKFGGEILGSAIGGAFGFMGQRSANRAMQANMQTNLAFQREVAQHGHQWAVADLKKAGLNPILSATQGVSPATASGGVSQPQIQNEAASAGQLARLGAEIDNIRADTKVKEQAEKTGKSEEKLNLAKEVGITTLQAERIKASLDKMTQDIEESKQRTLLHTTRSHLAQSQRDLAEGQHDLIREVTLPNGIIKTKELTYLLKILELEMKAHEGEHGEAMAQLRAASRGGGAGAIAAGFAGAGLLYKISSSLIGGLAKKGMATAKARVANKKAFKELKEFMQNAPERAKKAFQKAHESKWIKRLLDKLID